MSDEADESLTGKFVTFVLNWFKTNSTDNDITSVSSKNEVLNFKKLKTIE